MDRRKLVAFAQGVISDAMMTITETEELTVMEWLEVLSTAQKRLIAEGLKDEWEN
jgi:hypothetical protein